MTVEFPYPSRVLADSVSPAGIRLTTLEVVMPRIVLAEFNTHRVFSRNSASSRAIPVEKRIQQIRENPFVPLAFGANQKGMTAAKTLDEEASREAKLIWLEATNAMLNYAEALARVGTHKQLANRLTEFCSLHTAIVTATEWENFFNLRISPEAQPEIRLVAEAMKAAMDASVPVELKAGQWHTPFVDERDADVDEPTKVKCSIARCARVSYLTHDGQRSVEADLNLHDRLLGNGHMSPFEHAAFATNSTEFCGNFRGWVQYRKTIVGESVFTGSK